MVIIWTLLVFRNTQREELEIVKHTHVCNIIFAITCQLTK